jgi:hypothetical protein
MIIMYVGQRISDHFETIEGGLDTLALKAAIGILAADPATVGANANLRVLIVEQWLKLLAALDRHIDVSWDPADVPLVSLTPPPSGGVTYPSGVSPAAIRDPAARGEYEQAVREERHKADAYRFQLELHRIDEQLVGEFTGFLANSYATSEASRDELGPLLSSLPESQRTRLETATARADRLRSEGPQDTSATQALAPSISSETVAVAPGTRARTTIGVGEEVKLTHSTGSVTWATTAGILSASTGAAVTLTAPDTAQTVTVTGGTEALNFTVIAPTGVRQDPVGPNVKHTQNRPDSGIRTKIFLLPDTVNFYNIQYHEVDVAAVCTGVYSPFNGVSHDPHPATLTLSTNVVPGKGTEANAVDQIYSGDPGTPPPFAPGDITFQIPYEYKVGAGPFRQFSIVTQTSTLVRFILTDLLTSSKAGAAGVTTTGSPTSGF